MEAYLTDLPPSIGWFVGGQRIGTFHLVRKVAGAGMVTHCGGIIPLPHVYRLHSENWDGDVLCPACKERIDAWRRANAAEPQSNTA